MPGSKIILMGDVIIPTTLVWLVDVNGEDAYKVQKAGPPSQGRLRADFWGPIVRFLIDYFEADHIVLRKQGAVIGIEREVPMDELIWTLNGIKMTPDPSAPLDTVPAEFAGLQLSDFTTRDGVPCRHMSLYLGSRDRSDDWR